MEKVQEQFDALVKEFGAEAVTEAVFAHRPTKVHTDGGTGCTKDSDCATGYYCNGGTCTLKVGRPA